MSIVVCRAHRSIASGLRFVRVFVRSQKQTRRKAKGRSRALPVHIPEHFPYALSVISRTCSRSIPVHFPSHSLSHSVPCKNRLALRCALLRTRAPASATVFGTGRHRCLGACGTDVWNRAAPIFGNEENRCEKLIYRIERKDSNEQAQGGFAGWKSSNR